MRQISLISFQVMGKKLIKIVVIALVVVVVQTITFLTTGPFQLRNKLLSEHSLQNKFKSDSLYVMDYYIDDCGNMGYYSRHVLLNLRADSNSILEKFNSRVACFSDGRVSDWHEGERAAKYNIVYGVDARSPDWTSLYGLYGCKVEETICFKEGSACHKSSYYRWLLCFWVELDKYTDKDFEQKRSHISNLMSHI